MKGLWKWGLLVVGLGTLLLVWVQSRPRLDPASSLSPAASGWLAMRHYLVARQTTVEIIDQPLSQAGDGGTWVLTLPWSKALVDDDLQALTEHLHDGGDVLLAYSGDSGYLEEDLILRQLDLELTPLRSTPPLNPWDWWHYRSQAWRLLPEGAETEGAPGDMLDDRPLEGAILEMEGITWAPQAPPSARVLYRESERQFPLIFETRQQRGRVVVLPRQVLANGRLRTADNLLLLEQLRQRLASPWRIDEFHHGWQRPGEVSFSVASQAWDMFVIHLLVIYGLAVLALIRRFGPAWRQRPLVVGSAADYLRGVGSLHDQLGHHGDAARCMVQRARDLDPQLEWEDLDSEVEDGPGLVALGQQISRRQRRRIV